MYQQEIQFFWPLTEQVPLDLDFTECDKPRIYWSTEVLGTSGHVLSVGAGGTGLTFANPTWKTVISGWEVGSINYKPNLINKFFIRLLFGWKWMGK